MRILITGGTGMIGQALAKSLLAEGHEISVLTRNSNPTHGLAGVKAIGWDGRTTLGWGEALNQIDAVINLVGERLSKWPWTKAQRKRFWDSRVDGGAALVEAFQSASSRPQVLIQASGVNYYGPRGLNPVSESDVAGDDFLAELCKAWEGSTEPVEKLGVRRVIIRSAIVLSAHEGILPLMMLPVRLFAGGPLGTGQQGVSWIHLEDEVAAIHFLLEKQSASGPFNLTSPVPISNAEFYRVIARDLHRPYWLPLPAFLLRLALGRLSTLLTDGAYVLPRRLQELGFHFRFATIEEALGDLLRG